MKIPMFFVFGLPRSGTTWLGAFLTNCNPEWLICHEPHVIDFHIDKKAAFLPWVGDEHVSGPRHERMKSYIDRKFKSAHGYGEVTPRARYFSSSLQRFYPHARCVHLVRDPRYAVRSMIQYGYYALVGRPHRRVAPDQRKWSRVKRTAWAWAYGHNRIRQTLPDFVRLEDLLSDWSSMAALCSMLGINGNKAEWEKQRETPKNVSNETMEPWNKWPPSWRKELIEMCGPEARQYGYLTE